MGYIPDSYLALSLFRKPASWLSSRDNMEHLHSRWKGGKSSFVAGAISIFLFAIAAHLGQQSGAGATSKYLYPDSVNSFNFFLKKDFVANAPILRPPVNIYHVVIYFF